MTVTTGLALGRAAGLALAPLWRKLTAPPVARRGARLATTAAKAWARLLRGEETSYGELTVFTGLPKWAFGRGGTTVGSVFLTSGLHTEPVLRHEDVHRQQWQRYGLLFVPLYFAAGLNGRTNRFEIEAGLEDGGYLPRS